MWRSIASKASLATYAASKLPLSRTQSQVLRKSFFHQKTCTSGVDSASAFSRRHTLFQSTRNFSHSSSLDTSESESEEDTSVSALPDVHTDETNEGVDEAQAPISSVEEGLALDADKTSLEIDESVVEGIDEANEVNAEKLEKVLSLLRSSLNDSLESSLDDLQLSLGEDFVLRVLETSLTPGAHLLRFFRWVSEKNEFPTTTSVLFSLVRGVCQDVKRKDAYALWDLIKEIGEKENVLLNSEILNELISALSRLGKGKASYEVFNKFDEFGCVPNADTYYFTIEALCRRSMYVWAWSVCEQMLNAKIMPESEKIGEIISLFCKGNKAKEAHSIYICAKENGKYPPSRAVNFLISRLTLVDDTVEIAMKMLDDFSEKARKGAINPFSNVIKGLCRMNNANVAKELVLRMIKGGPPPGNATFNSVIGSLSKNGEMKDAMEMLRLMERRGLKPDVFTYSVIMSGYTKGGAMDEACRVLAEAKKEHSKLCPATYHTLIRGYCKLKDYKKALKLLGEMKSHGVQPNVDEYNKLIQSLCLEGLDWKTSEKLLGEMKKEGLFLPGITRGLINAVKELEQEALQNKTEV